MRDITITKVTSPTNTRRTLSIVEQIRYDGMIARAEKTFKYVIKPLSEQQTQHLAINGPNSNPLISEKNRHVRIYKQFDNRTGTGIMKYSVIGRFFVMQADKAFAVAFAHAIKFDMIKRKEELHAPLL